MSRISSNFASGSNKDKDSAGNSSSTGSSSSKLSMPKFLTKNGRDRTFSTATNPSGSGVAPPARTDSRKLLGRRKESAVPVPVPPVPVSSPEQADTTEEFPTIVEPQPHPPSPSLSQSSELRPRSRSERMMSFSQPTPNSQSPVDGFLPSSSTSRINIADIPTRLSGWFSHTFSASATDLSLPSLMARTDSSGPSQSPKRGVGGSALLAAAKHGRGHLDKAMRYLLDSDATPDRSTDPIWILGTCHPGYEPPPPSSPTEENLATPTTKRKGNRTASGSRIATAAKTQGDSTTAKGELPPPGWPPAFYADFTSRIWLSYRSQFAVLRDASISSLDVTSLQASGSLTDAVSASPVKRWNWPGTGEKTFTSDAGWGCMLRTGQSLLANALMHLHLGRDWRRPVTPEATAEYATYVQILTWFLDTPNPAAPFSVHRMALVGKELGTEVGQWFGPSIAAGAIRKLTNGFSSAGLGVSVATDSSIFQSEVYAASHTDSQTRHSNQWGDRGVLILIGLRLGLDGVHPTYYETIKTLFTFPQSVGIAGGRPSSSYYFLGTQGDNLFYLDPHHARPAVLLKPVPPYPSSPDRNSPSPNPTPSSPSSVRSGASHASRTASPLHQQHLSTSTSTSYSSSTSRSSLGLGSQYQLNVDAQREHYCFAYSAVELKTFHCDRVRKMPLNGLDPSMLVGFLCKNEDDWIDFRQRVTGLQKSIFAIQDEPPIWSDSDDYGLESISEPDDLNMDDEDEDEDDGEPFFNDTSRTRSPSTSPTGSVKGGAKSSEFDTEEDAAPVTPGPSVRAFEGLTGGKRQPRRSIEVSSGADDEDADEDDEWVHPTPRPASQHVMSSTKVMTPPPMMSSHSSDSSRAKRTKKKAAAAEAVEAYPFPQASPSPEPDDSWDYMVEKRMNNARARDGGRTQSGGVRGVLTPDDDF